MRFLIDSSDEWSSEVKKGISFEVQTRSAPTFEDGGLPLEKGLNEIQIPYALRARKGSLTGLEELALSVVSVAETGINNLGGNVDFTSSIQNRSNFLKISQPEITIAKLLYVTGDGIPANHRDLLGAELLQNKYWRSQSFVNASDNEPFNNQYQTFEGVEIQFDLQKFLTLRENSYFIGPDGESVKVQDFKWNPSRDFGTVNGKIRDVYDKSLTETTFELKNEEDD